MKTLRACLYWTDCLTEIRKIVKDAKWSVNMDDTELERDEKEGWQLPNKYYWNNNMIKIMEYETTSHNVPAVSDGLLFAIKKTRSVFRKQKTVAEQKCTKAAGRLRFCGARAAEWRGGVYSPVMRCFFACILRLAPFVARAKKNLTAVGGGLRSDTTRKPPRSFYLLRNYYFCCSRRLVLCNRGVCQENKNLFSDTCHFVQPVIA